MLNPNNLIIWSFGIITALAGVYNIDTIQREVIKAQAHILYHSRTETWGSPRFFNVPTIASKNSAKVVKKGN